MGTARECGACGRLSGLASPAAPRKAPSGSRGVGDSPSPPRKEVPSSRRDAGGVTLKHKGAADTPPQSQQ